MSYFNAHIRAFAVLALLLVPTTAWAGAKLHYTDVTSAPAGSYICVAGSDFPAAPNATLYLNAAKTCAITSFASYTNSWTRGTATSHACVEMPTSSVCGAIDSVILSDGNSDSNTLSMARHSGTVYWVTSSGSDSNSCTSQGSACRTPSGAYGKANDGDVVLVRAGTYASGSGGTILSMTDSATAAKPIVVRGYPGETPQLGPVTGSGDPHGIYLGGAYNQVAGMRVVGSGADIGKAISLESSNARYCRVADMHLGPWDTGSCIRPSGGSVHGMILGVYFDTCGDSPLRHGIYAGDIDDYTVAYSDFDGAGGFGMQIYAPGKSVTGIVVHNNIFRNNTTVQGGAGMGANSGSHGLEFYNNIVYNNLNHGMQIDTDATNVRVYNNTFYNNVNHQFRIIHDADGVVVKNNLFYRTTGGMLVYENTSGSNLTFDNNLYYETGLSSPWSCNGDLKSSLGAWQNCSFSPDDNSAVQDPLFVNIASNDVRIQIDSWAKDHATNSIVSGVNAPSTDHGGDQRPFGSAKDIGAFEYHDSVSQNPDPVPRVTGLIRTDSR